jgi:CxxC-x17-CxxC domain-containing protein
MNNFNRGGRFEKRGSGGFGSRGGDRGGFGGGDRGGFRGGRDFDKPKFPSVCAECGNECMVPFKPTMGKDVFCDNCFRKDDNRGPRPQKSFERNDRFGGDSRPPREDRNREQFDQLNAKLDMVLKAIERLKSPGKVFTIEADEAPVEVKADKKAKKAEKKEAKEEVAVEAKVEKKAAKKAAKKK